MKLDKVNSERTLFALSNVFSESITDQLNQLDWLSLPKNEDDCARRYKLVMPLSLDVEICQHARNVLFSAIEQQANIKFSNNKNFSTIYWMNSTGYRSDIHVDGNLPATMQIFWEPTDLSDYGTCFYNSQNTKDILHYFPSTQNTGYLSLAKKSNQPLWHGTTRSVAEDVLRVSFMFVLGDYTIL
jgi:hypothetical protein